MYDYLCSGNLGGGQVNFETACKILKIIASGLHLKDNNLIAEFDGYLLNDSISSELKVCFMYFQCTAAPKFTWAFIAVI